MRELRPHQINAIEMLRESIRRGNRRIILAAPCSFGKTTVASAMMESALAKGKKCIFIVDRVELVNQASARLFEDGIDHGIIQGQHQLYAPWKPVQVATIQTLAKRDTVAFDFAFVDEAHTIFKSLTDYMLRYDNIPFIGLTATPFSKGLGKYYQDLIVPITTGELMDQGYLCPYDVYAPSEPDLKGVKIDSDGDYNAAQLDERVNTAKLVGDIITTHAEKAKGRPTVVFACSIAHSKFLVDEFRKTGLRATHVDCFTDADIRFRINEQFKAGEIDVLSCVSIYEKGWDAPIASCLIMAAPTKSVIRYVQQVGRILRTHPGKDRSIILDHAGNTMRHGWVEEIIPDTLDKGERGENKSAKKEKKKAEPKKCPKCFALKDTHVCPMCGFTPEIKKGVECEAGTLEKKDKKSKAHPLEVSQWYRMFLHYAKEKEYSAGWAYFKTKEKFGTCIRDTKHVEPMAPSAECLRWIRSRNIRYAKSREKYGATA